MEKRFVSFLLLAAAILVTSQLVVLWLSPPPEVVDKPDAAEVQPEGQQVGDPEPNEQAEVEPPDDAQAEPPRDTEPRDDAEIEAFPVDSQQTWMTVGSLDRTSPYKMAVWFNSRGATVQCIALNDQWYHLYDRAGYLGYMALTDEDEGCRVNAVAHGSPAALAKSATPGIAAGLKSGDIITQVNGQSISRKIDVRQELVKTRRGDIAKVTVQRGGTEIVFTANLVRRPLEVIQTEPDIPTLEEPLHPMSYLTSLHQIGERRLNFGETELKGLPSLRDENWAAKAIDDERGPGIEFSYVIPAGTVPELVGDLIIYKRFRLARAPAQVKEGEKEPRLYHLTLELEFVYKGDKPLQLAYQQDGPTGLPLEGWWYTFKTHPTKFGGAGVRDIVVRAFGGGHKMFTNPKILKRADQAEEKGHDPATQMLPPEAEEETQLQYACVDAQYFASGLVADAKWDDMEAAQGYEFAKVWAMPVAKTNEQKPSKTNVSFRVESLPINVSAEGYRQEFLVFAGPKDPEILAQYGLDDVITYGWFKWIAKPLIGVLHFFYGIFGNFGIAVILLTVMVRGGMFPLGRQQALNAQKMQELAPEMKKIADKYKDNMEKRAEAQRELFRKNNYNPLSGCLPMFIQLPIFIGLYRALSVDIELRDAPLIPGIEWCSNLAGPDRLLRWDGWGFMPNMLVDYTGWLGPYLNILPLISVVFMLIHQKLFTPPPTDEQQEMQHRIMKFMMIFFAFMFFRVPAGLCLYFITSSAWGLAERKLLPKPKKNVEDTSTEEKQPRTMLSKLTKKSDSNGANKMAERRRQRQKRR